MVSGVVAAAAFVVPMVIGVEPEMHLTSSLMTVLQMSGPPIVFLALALTRRWGKQGKILFRRRPADERESRIMAETDSASITAFLLIAMVSAAAFFLALVVLPSSWRIAWEVSGRNGPAWFQSLYRVALASQSILIFVFAHAVIGTVKTIGDVHE